MRPRWRWAACVAIVLAAHAWLLAVLLQAPRFGSHRTPPHRMAAVRLVMVGRIAEPRAEAAAPRPPSPEGAAAPEHRPSLQAPVPAATPEPLAIATAPALAPDAIASAPPVPPAPADAPTRDFLSPAQVDRIAIAFPSPDITSLTGLSWSGAPMRLRLFVDASGRCVDVTFLSASEDAATLDRLRQMFLATRFIPARQAGEVDSYRDIELVVSDVK